MEQFPDNQTHCFCSINPGPQKCGAVSQKSVEQICGAGPHKCGAVSQICGAGPQNCGVGLAGVIVWGHLLGLDRVILI